MKTQKHAVTQSPLQNRGGYRSPIIHAVERAIQLAIERTIERIIGLTIERTITRILSRYRPQMPSISVMGMVMVIVMGMMTVLVGGCDVYQVSFDRDNDLDTSNPAYIPAPPGNLTIRKWVVNQRNIALEWEIQSAGHDGFLIEKSFGDDQPFEEFARLAPDRTIFSDTTRHLSPRMLYRVTSYVERDGELHRRLTDPLSIGYGDFSIMSQAVLYESPQGIYRVGTVWRDNIDIRVRDGYDIVAIRDDGHEYLIVSIDPRPRFEYFVNELFEEPDADRFRFLRIDAYYHEGDEKRTYSSIQAELNR